MSKKCPYCAEEIKDEATKCKHCQSSLDGEPVLIERTSKKYKGRILTSTCVIVLGFAMGIFHSSAADQLGGLMIGFGMLFLVLSLVTAWYHHG